MTAFALQEGIVKTAENVVACFGVKALDGSAGDMQVKEDMQEVLKKYKLVMIYHLQQRSSVNSTQQRRRQI